jgi:hypothetical protein
VLQYTDRVETQPLGKPVKTVNLQHIDAFATAGGPRHLTASTSAGRIRGCLMAKGRIDAAGATHIECTALLTDQAMCLGEVIASDADSSTLAEQRIKPYTVPQRLTMGAHAALTYEEWIAPDDDGQCAVVGYAVTGLRELSDDDGGQS